MKKSDFFALLSGIFIAPHFNSTIGLICAGCYFAIAFLYAMKDD